MQTTHQDLCIIGAGPAGLTIAAVAAQLGLTTTLIENGPMGGDCLNAGCVPSKTLLSLAGEAYRHDHPRSALGLTSHQASYESHPVHEHIQSVIQRVGERDAQSRFESLGATVDRGSGAFVDRQTWATADRRIKANKFVIATGSRPFIPPIPGLESVPYHTNETIFQLEAQSKRLVIIGGGPIGCELAQAHRRLGWAVTLLELNHILPKDDPAMVHYVRQQFEHEGIALYEGVTINEVESDDDQVYVHLTQGDQSTTLTGAHLLVATGRKPNVNALGLDQAGVQYTASGIQVNDRLRTSNKRIFAAGDVIGSYPFTHAAAYQASIILKNAVFRWPAKTHYHALPWVTYTAPALAHVGLTEADVKQQKRDYRIVTLPLDENDRFVIESQTHGFIKVVVTPKGRVLGASICAHGADDLITPWIIACQHRLSLKKLADLIIPYPTKSELVKQVASRFYAPKLFQPMMQKLAQWLV